jgi:hypothetical protein
MPIVECPNCRTLQHAAASYVATARCATCDMQLAPLRTARSEREFEVARRFLSQRPSNERRS